MSQPPEDDPSEADFEAIAAAVNETERGRWFLAEYNRRNRHADTRLVLDAIARLQSSLAERTPAAGAGQISRKIAGEISDEIADMADAIARTKAEIAAVRPQGENPGKIGDATIELDAIVETTERATSDILAAAERVQEIAWTLREQGVDSGICDLLDQHTTQTYTACSFQDLTGQRIRKIVNVLGFLEARIETINRIWCRHETPAAAAPITGPIANESSLTSGPARPGEGLEQFAIDDLLEADTPPETDPAGDICWQDTPDDEDIAEPAAPHALATPEAMEAAEAVAVSPAPEPAAPEIARAAPPNARISRTALRKSAAPGADPIEALTPTERLALFS